MDTKNKGMKPKKSEFDPEHFRSMMALAIRRGWIRAAGVNPVTRKAVQKTEDETKLPTWICGECRVIMRSKFSVARCVSCGALASMNLLPCPSMPSN